MRNQITLLIVDDHAIIRSGLRGIFDSVPDVKVIGEARNGVEAKEKASALLPDVILMDIYMPQKSGLEAMQEIKAKLPDIKVIMLSVSGKENDVLNALKLGAVGYILKDATTDEIVNAVKRAAGGESSLPTNVLGNIINKINNNSEIDGLSNREIEVMRYMGEGLTNNEIAAKLFISESTVRTYIHRIQEKLNLKNRAQITAYASRKL